MDYRGAVTFEDRMEARKEQLLRYLLETPEALQSRAVRGMVAQADVSGVRLKPWHQSMTPNGPVLAPRVRNDVREDFVDWNVEPVRKRTLDERIESFVKRLLDAPPELQEKLITETQGTYWKAGMPVTREDLRAVAAKYLNRRSR